MTSRLGRENRRKKLFQCIEWVRLEHGYSGAKTGWKGLEPKRTYFTTCEKEGWEKFRTNRIVKLVLARMDRTVQDWMSQTRTWL